MIVVSDASPLVTLARIGRLELLAVLYGRVIVPEAVWQEITGVSAEKAGVVDLRQASWLEHRTVKDLAAVESLRLQLDRGESEAVVLSLELGADLLLMDERAGREAAQRKGLRVIGLLGLLSEAKQRRIIGLLAPVLEELRQADFRMSAELVDRVLRQAGE